MTPKVTKTMMLISTILTGVLLLINAFAFLGPNGDIIKIMNLNLNIEKVTFLPPVLFMAFRLILTIITCVVVYSKANNRTKFITSLVMLLVIEVSSFTNLLMLPLFYRTMSAEAIAGVSGINSALSFATFLPSAAAGFPWRA